MLKYSIGAVVIAIHMLAGQIGTMPAHSYEISQNVVAVFEGEMLVLSDDWGEATACTSDNGTTARCYRSEADMDEAEASTNRGVGSLACSGNLRLYEGTLYGGRVLNLNVQYQLVNLALFGFSNITSSYTVGPCNAYFYDSTTGTGSYPGNTTANSSSPIMAPGWNDRISSVYIS